MNQKGEVLRNKTPIGTIEKKEGIYYFTYTKNYLESKESLPISVNFPLQKEPFLSEYLFGFFYGLLSEGINKKIQCQKLKIDEEDHFTRLLKTAHKDTIGSITIKEISNE